MTKKSLKGHNTCLLWTIEQMIGCYNNFSRDRVEVTIVLTWVEEIWHQIMTTRWLYLWQQKSPSKMDIYRVQQELKDLLICLSGQWAHWKRGDDKEYQGEVTSKLERSGEKSQIWNLFTIYNYSPNIGGILPSNECWVKNGDGEQSSQYPII